MEGELHTDNITLDGEVETENVELGTSVLELAALSLEGTIELGPRGAEGVGIADIEQTRTEPYDGGENEITVTLTNGAKYKFYVKNGGTHYDVDTVPTEGSSSLITSGGVYESLQELNKKIDERSVSETTCSTEGSSRYKDVDIDNYIVYDGKPVDGSVICVTFTNRNTANDVLININSATGYIPVYFEKRPIDSYYIKDNVSLIMIYDRINNIWNVVSGANSTMAWD